MRRAVDRGGDDTAARTVAREFHTGASHKQVACRNQAGGSGHSWRRNSNGADLPNNIPVRRIVGWNVQTPVPSAQFRFRIGSEPILITRPILYRYVDKVLGDRTQPFAVVPPVSVRFAESTLVFPSKSPRDVNVTGAILFRPYKRIAVAQASEGLVFRS